MERQEPELLALKAKMEAIMRLRRTSKVLSRAIKTVQDAESGRRQAVLAARAAGLSHAEVAHELGVGRGRAAQIEREARHDATRTAA